MSGRASSCLSRRMLHTVAILLIGDGEVSHGRYKRDVEGICDNSVAYNISVQACVLELSLTFQDEVFSEV